MMRTEADLNDIRVIIFDWGGTLCGVSRELDTHRACAQGAVAYCRRHGLATPAESAEHLLALHRERKLRAGAPPEYREYDLRETLRDWLGQLGIAIPPDGFIEHLTAAFWDAWIGCLDLYDGVAPMLQRLSSHGYVLGLLSNVAAVPDACAAQLRHLGIHRHLKFAEYSSRVGHRKPHPAAYEAALAGARLYCLDLTTDQVLFVGDAPEKDIVAPAGMGMRTALVGIGTDPPDVGADLYLARVADLPQYLPGRNTETSKR